MTYTIRTDASYEGVEVPMTEIFFVGLHQDYEWDEGRLFRHDETGLYAFIHESGCSCNSYLSWLDDEEHVARFVRELDWTPLDQQISRVIEYINSDETRCETNGPAWRAEHVATFHVVLMAERKREASRGSE